MNAVLELEDLTVNYGRVQALQGLSLRVDEGEIVTVLGSNGAGKTSTLSAISGVVRPASGSVKAFGRDVTKDDPWTLVSHGIIHVPEGRRIFSRLTIEENLQLGGYLVRDTRLVSKRINHVYDMLPRLAERRTQQGGTLSGGEQQMLALGRAMVAGPRLLMLDEPSMGLAPLIVVRIMELITAINDEGTAVLLVEQNARAALKIANRAYVIDNGQSVLTGDATTMANDPRIIEAYLGS